MAGVITNDGKKIVLDRIFNTSPTRNEVNQFKVGIGTTAASTADTGLVNAIPITGTETVDDCETADWADSADMTTSLNSTTFKEGSNSLNLTKDAGTATTASTSKTTTSVDFTSKEFSVWIYVKDSTALAKLVSTDALTVRFGSDASNYYQWTRNSSELTAGQWNLVQNLSVSNADSTTGSPSLAAMDYTYLALEAAAAGNTWSAGDFMMDDIKVVSSDDYLKAFESGYPLVDLTSFQVELRGRLATGDALGYPITEMGIFNDDGTPLLFSRDVFTSISKSSGDEIIFSVKVMI